MHQLDFKVTVHCGSFEALHQIERLLQLTGSGALILGLPLFNIVDRSYRGELGGFEVEIHSLDINEDTEKERVCMCLHCGAEKDATLDVTEFSWGVPCSVCGVYAGQKSCVGVHPVVEDEPCSWCGEEMCRCGVDKSEEDSPSFVCADCGSSRRVMSSMYEYEKEPICTCAECCVKYKLVVDVPMADAPCSYCGTTEAQTYPVHEKDESSFVGCPDCGYAYHECGCVQETDEHFDVDSFSDGEERFNRMLAHKVEEAVLQRIEEQEALPEEVKFVKRPTSRWMKLAYVANGSLFETQCGMQYVKTAPPWTEGKIGCVEIGNGRNVLLHSYKLVKVLVCEEDEIPF